MYQIPKDLLTIQIFYYKYHLLTFLNGNWIEKALLPLTYCLQSDLTLFSLLWGSPVTFYQIRTLLSPSIPGSDSLQWLKFPHSLSFLYSHSFLIFHTSMTSVTLFFSFNLLIALSLPPSCCYTVYSLKKFAFSPPPFFSYINPFLKIPIILCRYVPESFSGPISSPKH